VVDVPDDIIALAVDEVYLPLSQESSSSMRARAWRSCELPGQRYRSRLERLNAHDTTSTFVGVLHRILVQPTRGVVGLVDDLFAACREHNLQLDWQADRWRVRSPRGRREELDDLPLRKSIFRAILARVAALCNERSPNSISPYGGQGELTVGTNPATVFRVAFTNTPSEQKFELMRVRLEAVDGGNGSEAAGNAPLRTEKGDTHSR